MKKLRIHKRLTALTASLVLLFSCVGFSASAEQSNLTPAEQYAAYIDSLDWPSYNSHVGMVEAAQIPESILNQMSTEDLVDAFLVYPLRVDLIAWDTYELGFQMVRRQFNGLDTLSNCPDGTIKILKKMQSISSATSVNDVNSDQSMDLFFLEILLVQPEFMSQFSKLLNSVIQQSSAALKSK